VIVDLISNNVLFQGVPTHALQTPYQFETQYMSRIERDHSMDLNDTRAVLEDLLGVRDSTLLDRQIVKRVCELVGIRAARLSAGAVAGIITRMNRLNGYIIRIFLRQEYFLKYCQLFDTQLHCCY
jgi:hexokinase